MRYKANGTICFVGKETDKLSFVYSRLFNTGKIITPQAHSFLKGLNEFEYPNSDFSDEECKWFEAVKDSFFVPEEESVESLLKKKNEKYLQELSTGSLTNGLALQINSCCNFKCRYCIAEQKLSHEQNMTFSTAKKAVDTFVNFRLEDPSFDFFNISYVGKEPLLCFDLIKKVEIYLTETEKTIVKSTGRKITHQSSFISNLSLATPEIIAFCKDHKIKITTSLDGNKAANDSNRFFKASNMSVYDHVIQKMIDFKEADYPVKCVNMVITKASMETLEYEPFLRTLSGLGVETLGISFDELIPGEISIDTKVTIIQDMLAAAKNVGGITISGDFGKPFSNLIKTFNTSPVTHCIGTRGGSVTVDHSGHIHCCNYLEDTNVPIDSLRTALLPGGVLYETTKKSLAGNNKACTGCELEGSCLGGCLASVGSFSDEQRNMFCNFEKEITRSLIEKSITSMN